ncbi:MAG: GNAT family N-acetyltransferase [Clostridia bacterium]|nr:GNAT family N-acetyltransferase [Clostridia bacterium]
MKYTTPALETKRLRLMRGSLDDFQKVYEYDFCKLRGILGEFEFVKQDPEKIKGFETYADEDDALDWIIYLKESNAPIGNLTADRIRPELNAIELAFNLHPDHWGHEYMMEACFAAMDHLFSLGFDNIICGYSEGNLRSKRVGEKMGFELYSVKENAWQKNGVPITDYDCILSKEKFYALHSEYIK